MRGWIEEELRTIDLGDKRLDNRLKRIVHLLSKNPTASIPQATKTRADTKATYRFFDCSGVNPDDIRDAHYQSTVERCKGHDVILVVQDSTGFDFTNRCIEDIGVLNNEYQRGLMMHSGLAVSTNGIPLGLLHQNVWSRRMEEGGRAEKKEKRHKKRIEEKESYRWIETMENARNRLPVETNIVIIGDREADIYELFTESQKRSVHILIRAEYNRRVESEEKYLLDTIKNSPVRGRMKIRIEHARERKAREADLSIRYVKIMLCPPRRNTKRDILPPISVNAILLNEENPPPHVKAVNWLLITTLPVNCLEDAIRCAEWYKYRWLIERYHYVLKSGCKIEELQLETKERLERALATYCIVAWRELWLTYEARKNPDTPADKILEKDEIEALYCTIHETKKPPEKVPTVREAVRWIAQLGGFLGRKSDGEPGVKTIWRGLMELAVIVRTWRLLRGGEDVGNG